MLKPVICYVQDGMQWGRPTEQSTCVQLTSESELPQTHVIAKEFYPQQKQLLEQCQKYLQFYTSQPTEHVPDEAQTEFHVLNWKWPVGG